MSGEDVEPVGLPDDYALSRLYELRSRPFEIAVRMDTGWCGSTRVVSYEPGNGTRYLLIFARGNLVPADVRSYLGFAEGWVSIAWVYEGKSIVLAENDGFLHWSYVREKLQCSVPTAVVLAEVFAFVLGRSAMTCEEWANAEQRMGK